MLFAFRPEPLAAQTLELMLTQPAKEKTSEPADAAAQSDRSASDNAASEGQPSDAPAPSRRSSSQRASSIDLKKVVAAPKLELALPASAAGEDGGEVDTAIDDADDPDVDTDAGLDADADAEENGGDELDPIAGQPLISTEDVAQQPNKVRQILGVDVPPATSTRLVPNGFAMGPI